MNDTDIRPGEPWVRTADAAMIQLETSTQGLPDAEARQRLERFGPNQLREKPPRPVW